MKRNAARLLILFGTVCILLSVAGLIVLNRSTSHEEVFTFQSQYRDQTSTLEASYYPIEDSTYAALICPGFSCDRQKLRSIAAQFIESGLTVMTFDYSGQGASSGVIGFDNAKTEHIPTEIADALEQLHAKSGIAYDHIFLVGHSMGGRSILRLFTMERYADPVAGAILIAPEVDYVPSAQASLFAGTSDENEAPWKDYDSRHLKGTSVYLISSVWDDTVSHKSTIELYKRLGGELSQQEGKVLPMRFAQSPTGERIGLAVTSMALHSYQMYLPQIKEQIQFAVSDATGTNETGNLWHGVELYVLWLVGFAGVFMLLTGAGASFEEQEESLPVLLDYRKFRNRKWLLWIPALLVMFLLCCLSVAMPFGSPVLNIVFMGSIAGYGTIQLLAYRKGKFPGTSGKLPRPSWKVRGKGLFIALPVTVLMLVYMVFAVRAGLYRVMPWNFRAVFLAFAGSAMAIGFYSSGVESEMLKRAGVPFHQKLTHRVIQYVPILLYTVSYLALGSVSGLIEQLQNLFFMSVFALPLGNFFRKLTGNRLYGACITAFSFQSMMLMSTALIAVF